MPGPAPPVIDIEVFRSGGSDIDRRVDELDRAGRDSGFFAVTGHGIEHHLVDLVFDQARRFFASPVAEKAAVGIERSPNATGWIGPRPGADANDGWFGEEALSMLLEPAALRPPGAPEPTVSQMPPLDLFALTVIAYQRAALEAAAIVLRGLALALELRAGFFERRMRDPGGRLELHHLSGDATGDVAIDGCGPLRRVPGLIAVSCFDDTVTVQVRSREGRWNPFEIPDGALVVSLGDLMARWTNDRYVSSPHRLVASSAGGYSATFCVNPDATAVVEPMPSCVGLAHPARYEPATAGDLVGPCIATAASLGTTIA